MSTTTSTTPAHLTYRKVTAKNAKCDLCNTRNLGVMQKCVTCGVTTCEHCKAAGRYDSKHNLANLNLDWAQPKPSGKGVKSSVRRGKVTILIDSSDDDDDDDDDNDNLFVPQTPRAPRAPGTSRREGLIRERATMTAACNLRRAREDQAHQRQVDLGVGSGSCSTTQPAQARDLRPKTGPRALTDDENEDLMEITAPPSTDSINDAIRNAGANIAQNLRGENEVLTGEIQRLSEQLKQKTAIAEEARLAYSREVASHKQTIDELSGIGKEHDDRKEKLSDLSSETMPNNGETTLAISTATIKSEPPRPALSLAMSPAPSTGASGRTTRAEAGSIHFSDLSAVMEARRNQYNAGMFADGGRESSLPKRIPRNPFHVKRRKTKHTSSSADILDLAARDSSLEDKDTLMEDASSDTISLASADKRKEGPETATSQAKTAMKTAGTQTRLSAASFVGPSTPIGKDADASVLQAVFSTGSSRGFSWLKIPDGSGRSVNEQVLHGVKRKWERSASFQKMKAVEGALPALQTLEAAASLGCLARRVAFPPSADAYIQGIRAALLREREGEPDATTN